MVKNYYMPPSIWLLKKMFGCSTRRFGRKGIFFKNHLLNLKKAPEPGDIIWENRPCSIFETLVCRINGFLITMLMISTSAFAITSLTYLEHYIQVIYIVLYGVFHFYKYDFLTGKFPLHIIYHSG